MTDGLDSALTGAAFELANAGYKPMPDSEEKEEAETIAATAPHCARLRRGDPIHAMV